MSLEVAIQENTAAIRELIAAIGKGMPVAASTVAAVAETTKAVEAKTAESKPAKAAEPKTEKTKAEAKKPAAETASSQPGATQPSEDQTDDALDADSKVEVTYEDAKKALLTLSKEKGREPTVALLSRYGVAKGPDLEPDQWAPFIKDVEAILAGTYDPESAEELA